MKRILPLVVFMILIICLLIWMPKTNVNYDMTQYLPDNSLTKQGSAIMKEEFAEESSIQIMIHDVSIAEVLQIKTGLSVVDGIKHVTWLDDYIDVSVVPIELIPTSLLESFYQAEDALLSITLDYGVYDIKIDETLTQLRNTLSDYETNYRGDILENREVRLIAKEELFKIMVILIPIIIFILLMVSTSWIEPVLILIALGVAVILNLLTNGLFEQVSFITQTMCLALQLALSIDYAIFIIHRYQEERMTSKREEAITKAVKHSIKPITISALTTIAGFVALTFMKFTIGKDIAFVLSKGILFSYLSSVLLLPALLFIFDQLLVKSKHKVLMPKYLNLFHFQTKYKWIIFSVFVLLFGLTSLLQSKAEYLYGTSSTKDSNSVLSLDIEEIEIRYDSYYPMIVLVPNETIEQEIELYENLLQDPNTQSVISLLNLVDPNIPREMVPEEIKAMYIGENYTRMIVYTDIITENDEMFLYIERIKLMVSENYSEFYLISSASAIYDIKTSVEKETSWVLLLTILLVGCIVGMIFRSFYIPIILVGVIVAAIFTNISIFAIAEVSVLYIGYLIVMSIQLGATIDYAVLFTHRYLEERKTKDPITAHQISLSKTANSILVSGGILTIVGFAEGVFSRIDSITKIGIMIGIGSLLSIFMILVILPVFIRLLDPVITRKKI